MTDKTDAALKLMCDDVLELTDAQWGSELPRKLATAFKQRLSAPGPRMTDHDRTAIALLQTIWRVPVGQQLATVSANDLTLALGIFDRLSAQPKETGKVGGDVTLAFRLAEDHLFNEDADDLDADEVNAICWALFRAHDPKTAPEKAEGETP